MASATEELAALTRADYEKNREMLEPYEADILSLIDSNQLVDDARDSAGDILERGTAQTARSMSRYGVGQTGAMARAASKGNRLGATRSGTGLINNAIDAQDSMRASLTGNMLSYVQGRRKNALQGLGDVAGFESQSKAAQAQANAAARQQRNSLLGTAAMAAAFFL